MSSALSVACGEGITNFGTLPRSTKRYHAAISSRWLMTASE